MAALPVPADPQQVAMVAGETSGDLLAALLFQGMRARWPALQGVGIGGSHMVAQGFDAWWPSERLAVRGYVEVLRHYRGIVAIRRQLRDRLLAQPPSVFVGVDAPDFNLDLEADLKATGVKTVHFVAPAIWAWRPERAAKIRRSVDHVLCVFPFEPELLAQHGIPATYVGHPLAPHIPLVPDRSAARARLGLPDGVQVLAVASADAAIAQLAAMNRVPSLLLVDAQLASEPAMQAVARINDEFNTEFPLILCSDEELLAAPPSGGNERSSVLVRPFSAERLRDAINRSLSQLRG